jgi:hypothetical protein
VRKGLVALLVLMGCLATGKAEPQSASRIASVFSGTVATTGTTLAAANGARLSIICTDEDSAIAIYVGGSDVTSTGGVRVAAGSSITLTSTAQVRARSASATPTVSCIEERR